MKVAISIGAAALLAVLLIVFLTSDEQAGDIRHEPERAVGDEPLSSGAPAVTRDDGTSDTQTYSSEPDREINAAAAAAAAATEHEEPPRSVAGLPAVKKSVELPVIDPATLPHDPNIGRIEVSSAAPVPNQTHDDSNHPMYRSGTSESGMNDGPLAGQTASPNANVPGPSGMTIPESTGNPNNSNPSVEFDPLGPGRPIDPSTADAAPPMYRLPGADVDVQDPDSSADDPD